MDAAALQPAYALHSRRYRESSLIVDFLTRDHGRVAALAKGAIGGKQSRQQMLQPFSPLLIAWRGRGELPTLTALEPATKLVHPQGISLYCGLYVNELVLKLTERSDPHSELFPDYAMCMSELLQAPPSNEQLEPILRRFEVRLLDELGLGMALTTDRQGQPIEPAAYYRYEAVEGAVTAQQTETTVSGSSLLALANGVFNTDRERSEARHLMRRVLAHHLGGRELKSRELFQGTSRRS